MQWNIIILCYNHYNSFSQVDYKGLYSLRYIYSIITVQLQLGLDLYINNYSNNNYRLQLCLQL